MSKHAIFLRGNMRTWNYIKKDIISFFDEYHEKPDWYVCFWQSNTSTIDEVTDSFKNSNLKYLKFETENIYQKFNMRLLEGAHTRGEKIVSDFLGRFSQVLFPYWRLAYLDQLLSIAKRKYELENNISYHSVFFARPDIIYKTSSDHKDYVRCLNELDDMEITNLRPHNTRLGNKNNGNRFDNYVTSDTFILAGNIAADIFGARFIDTDYTEGSLSRMINWDVHQLVSRIKTKYQLYELAELETKSRIIVDPVINRPNNLSQNQWDPLPKEVKHQICRDLNIDPFDYNLKLPS